MAERRAGPTSDKVLCVSAHSESLRARLRAIPVGTPPAPWVVVPPLAVGGLTNIGVSAANGTDMIMTISHDGRRVVDGRGTRVARDHTEPDDGWLDEFALEASGIGPLEGERLRIAGLSGGGLPLGTHDGWHVARVVIDWPSELVILEPPGCGALWPGHEAGCLTVFSNDAMELRVAGFSPSGRTLVIGTASDLHLYVRESSGPH